MPSDKDALFFESRSEAVLATCVWLGPIMNRVHGTQFSEKFWTRALLKYAVAAYNQKAHFDEESFRYPISFEAINGWVPPGRKKIIQDVVLTSLRSLKGAYSAKDIARSLLGVSRVAFGPRGEIFGLELAAAPLSFNWIPYLGRPDSKVRKSLRTASQDAPTLHYRNVCRNVPRLYVEFFGNLLRLFERAQSSPITDIFVEHYGSSFERLFAAYLSERGTAINQLQTGGFVGETMDSIAPMPRAAYDYLLTYGWAQGPQDRLFYAVRLEEFRVRYLAERSDGPPIDVLVVYNSSANSDALIAHFGRCTDALVEGLDRQKYPVIRLRPRAQSRVLRLTKPPPAFKKVAKNEIDSGNSSMANLCAKSRLVVHLTTPSTNFLECIFVDKPVLAVDTNERPTDLLKPYLSFFREVGVMHPDPESLVSHLNGIDIDSWWCSVQSDTRYSEFKNLFTREKAMWQQTSHV